MKQNISQKISLAFGLFSGILFLGGVFLPSVVFAQTTETGPSIVSVSAQALDSYDTSVSITTDKPTSAEVDYGLSTNYGESDTDADLTTTHSFTISGLSPGTTYAYRIAVTDASNDVTYSNNSYFSTPPDSSQNGTSGTISSGGTSGDQQQSSGQNSVPLTTTSVQSTPSGVSQQQAQTTSNQPTLGPNDASNPSFQIVPCSGVTDPNNPGHDIFGNTATNCDFAALITLVQRIINLLIYAATFVAVVSIVYAGFLYLTAGPDTGKVKRAHEIFRVTVIGFAIALCSWLVVYTVITAVVNTNFTFPQFLQQQ